MSFPDTYLSGLLTLAAVLVLFLLVVILMKIMQKKGVLPSKASGHNKLVLTDQLLIDNQTRFITIKRHNTNHLVLLSPNGNLVIESNFEEYPS